MTFRRTVENGRIELPVSARLADRTGVEVQPVPKKGLKPAYAAFGMWKNRRDLGKDPVKSLRARARRKRAGK